MRARAGRSASHEPIRSRGRRRRRRHVRARGRAPEARHRRPRRPAHRRRWAHQCDLVEDWNAFPIGPFNSATSPSYLTDVDQFFDIVDNGIVGPSLRVTTDGIDDNIRMRSPVNPSPAQGFAGATFQSFAIDAIASFTPVAPQVPGVSGQYIITCVVLRDNGIVEVLQIVDGSAVWFDSGFTWTTDETMQLGIDLDDDGTFRVFKNGRVSSIVYTDVSFAITDAKTGGIESIFLETFSQVAGAKVFFDDVTNIKFCSSDVDGSGSTDLADLLAVLAAFGASNDGDVDGSGTTDLADLLTVLAGFADTCPA